MDVKALIQSRTFWANAITGASVLASFFKVQLPFNMTTAPDTMVDVSGHVFDAIALISTVASTWFRVQATSQITSVLPK